MPRHPTRGKGSVRANVTMLITLCKKGDRLKRAIKSRLKLFKKKSQKIICFIILQTTMLVVMASPACAQEDKLVQEIETQEILNLENLTAKIGDGDIRSHKNGGGACKRANL